MPASYLTFLAFWLIALQSLAASAGVPVITGLNNLTVDEQDPAIIIDVDIGTTGGGAYSDGSITFSLADAVASDILALSSDSDVDAAGAISVTDGDVYLGNGAGRDRIGSVDSTNNGQNGAPLSVLFSSPLVNGNFETGDVTGWTVYEEQYPNDADINGDSIPWVQTSPANSGTGTVLLATTTSANYTVQAVTSPVSQGTYAMQLLISGGISCTAPGSGQNPDGYCSTHGPYADSTAFEAFNGDQIFVEWSAQNGGDWYEVFGFLIGNGPDDVFNTADDTETLLFSQRGDTRVYTPSNATITVTDTYKFRFVSGTYDASGGLGVGASLYVDGVRLVGGTAVADSAVQSIARLVTFHNSSDTPPEDPRVLTVKAIAQDGSEGSATANITINPINDEPEITSHGGGGVAAAEVPQSLSVLTSIIATDPDTSNLVYSLIGGADANKFSIDAATGEIRFVSPASNTPVPRTYVVQVQVSDGEFSTTQMLTITLVDAAPVVTAPVDLTVNAKGLLTRVDLSGASVTDITDGVIKAIPNKPGPFAPGTHTILWQSTDSVGNVGQATQILKVRPLANFARDQVIDDKGAPQVVVKAFLNGTAADYPVTIPYTVSGTADNPSDHNLAGGEIEIASGRSGRVTFNVVDDGAGDDGETIILSMGTLTNAAVGALNEHLITLSEVNEAPRVTLTLNQNGLAANSIAVIGNGNIVATATVSDPNTGDTHSFDWAGTNAALLDTDSAAGTFTFDPAALAPGVYRLAVSVTDDASSPLLASAKVDVLIQAAAPNLAVGTDSDGDGIDDATEGYGDADNDGVPDYLDGIADSNVLSGKRGDAETFLIETNPGLRLRLGSVAIGTGNGASKINGIDIQTHIQSPLDDITNVGGYFDFEVSELPIAGQTISLVMAQAAQVPANPVYRKLISGSWSDFIINGTDSIASAAGDEGYCPPPGDSAYVDGLTPGHWCVQVIIQDGGPNDADGEVNSRVVDPSGVGSLGTVTVRSSRSGGSLSFWAIALLGLIALSFRSSNASKQLSALLLLVGIIPSGYANDGFDFDKLSIGGQLMFVDSDEYQNKFNRRLENAGSTARVDNSDEERSGWAAYVGYAFTDRFQVELGYADLGKAEIGISGLEGDVSALLDTLDSLDVHEPSGDGITLTGKYSYAMSEDWSAYGKFGLFNWSSDIDLVTEGQRRSIEESGTDFLYGLGIEHSLMKQISAAVGWQRYEFDNKRADSFQLTLIYHLGH